MAKKKANGKAARPDAIVTVEFYSDRVEVEVTNAHALTAGRLQRSFKFIYQALHREHTSIRRRRNKAIKEQEEAALLEMAEV